MTRPLYELERQLRELRAAAASAACPGCGCKPGHRCPVGNERVIALCFVPSWATDRKCTACRDEATRITWDDFNRFGEEQAA